MATVKILYVRNLMLPTTEEVIEKEFNSINPGEPTNSLFNILISGYASVFFTLSIICQAKIVIMSTQQTNCTTSHVI